MRTEFTLPFKDAFKTYALTKIQANTCNSYFDYLKSLENNFFRAFSEPSEPSPFEMLRPNHLLHNTLQSVIDALYNWKAILDCEIHQPQFVTLSQSYMRNWMSAYSLYISFIEEYFGLCYSEPCEDNNAKPDINGLDSEMKRQLRARKIIYGDTLEKSCKIRLRGQDRMSLSRKVNLPINFISQVAQMLPGKSDEKGLINDWISSMYSRITVLIEKDGETCVTPVRKIKIIRLYKDRPATVELTDSPQCYTMLTRTANGDIIPMRIAQENQLHIDHEPSVDEVLRNNEADYPALSRISDIIKDVAKNNSLDARDVHDASLAECIKSDKEASSEIISLFPKLKNELASLEAKFERLELMHSSENCSKSNN